jgi:hypothetical protein
MVSPELLQRLENRLQKLRSRGQSYYSSIRWDVLLVLGGAANFLAVRAFNDYYQFVTSPLYVWTAIGTYPASLSYLAQVSIIPLALLFTFPIILSVALTRLMPEKRIVPPFYLQMVTLAGIVVFSVATVSVLTDAIPILLLGFMYTVIGGVVQDRATSALFGISAERESIVTSTLEVPNASPEDIVRIISNPVLAISLVAPPERVNDTFVFKNPRGIKYETRIEIKRRGNGSIINLAVFDRTRYHLRYSDELGEQGRARHVILRDFLSRTNAPQSPQKKLIVKEPPENLSYALVDSIMDETHGLWVKTQRLNRIGWAKIVLFIVALGIVGVFVFELKDYPSAYATLALIILYLVFEVPSKLKRD